MQHCQCWHAEVDCAPAVGRWEVRIGLPGGRHVYLGLYPSEPEAARVYDRALVLLSGPAAATNFPTSNYQNEMALYARCAKRCWPTAYTIVSHLTRVYEMLVSHLLTSVVM